MSQNILELGCVLLKTCIIEYFSRERRVNSVGMTLFYKHRTKISERFNTSNTVFSLGTLNVTPKPIPSSNTAPPSPSACCPLTRYNPLLLQLYWHPPSPGTGKEREAGRPSRGQVATTTARINAITCGEVTLDPPLRISLGRAVTATPTPYTYFLTGEIDGSEDKDSMVTGRAPLRTDHHDSIIHTNPSEKKSPKATQTDRVAFMELREFPNLLKV